MQEKSNKEAAVEHARKVQGRLKENEPVGKEPEIICAFLLNGRVAEREQRRTIICNILSLIFFCLFLLPWF